MSKFVFSENMYGRKVKFISDEAHMDMPEYYPAVGTVGTVIEAYDEYYKCNDWKVQWPKGSTSGDDCWFCDEEDVELIEEVDKQMTNEEIWEMLRPKMIKNGLKEYQGGVFLDGLMTPGYYVYIADKAKEAIAIAYRSGYERAMKGRPFKIDNKKKGGHWEPIDPNNLPKEGTKVRYTREYKGYNWLKDSLCIGTKGTLTIDGPYSRIGMMLDRPTSFLAWADFEDEEAIACLDMWVEDNE